MTENQQWKRKVFYADDDPDDLEFVRESFAKHAPDLELITFNSAVDLLEYIHNTDTSSPCLVILDINMPGLNGKDALKILRNIENYEDVPVIVFTTSNDRQDHVFAERLKAGYLSKPLNERQMDIIVEKFLDHCRDGARKR